MGTHPIFESDFDCLTEKKMGLFGAAKADPKKQVNEMSQLLRRETRAIERQIRDIERQQQKTTQMLKQNAKKGDKEACRILAKELVNSKKAVSRMYQSKAQVNSVMMNMKTQLATIRITGAVEKSTAVMASMSSLDPEDIEEAADTEIEKVLYELTEGAIGSMPAAGSTNLPTAEAEEEDEIDDDMLNRLAGLRA